MTQTDITGKLVWSAENAVPAKPKDPDLNIFEKVQMALHTGLGGLVLYQVIMMRITDEAAWALSSIGTSILLFCAAVFWATTVPVLRCSIIGVVLILQFTSIVALGMVYWRLV